MHHEHDPDARLPEAQPTAAVPNKPPRRAGKSLFNLKPKEPRLPQAPQVYVPNACPNPEAAYIAAAHRAIGKSQADAAEAAGVCASTVARWEKTDWWLDIHAEAVRVEHGELQASALGAARALLRGPNPDGVMARWILERLDPKHFGPPKVRAELSGPDGAPLEHSHTTTHVIEADKAQEVARLLRQMDTFAHIEE